MNYLEVYRLTRVLLWRKHKDILIPVIQIAKRPSERNKQITIKVLQGTSYSSFELSTERIRQIVAHTVRICIPYQLNPEDMSSYPMEVRTSNCLRNNDIYTVAQFMAFVEQPDLNKKMSKMPNFGKISLLDVRELYREFKSGKYGSEYM